MVLLVAAASPVFAQSAGAAEQTGSEEELKRVARAALGAGEYARALELLRELEARYGTNTAIRYNISVCYEQLGEPASALDEIEAIDANEMSAAQATRVNEALGRLTRQVARVSVRVPDVQLSVGERSCVGPCTLRINPGPQEARMERDGARDRQTFTAVAGEESQLLWTVAEVPDEQSADEPAPVGPEPDERGYGAGSLVVTGAVLAAVGAAGTIGFGLRTQSLRDDYDAATQADIVDEMMADQIRNDGERSRRITNASIAVAVVGGALMLVDLIIAVTD
ncbi:MAG: tetratricopeptide repeat protein [Myxococcota bacterium]